MPIPVSLDSLLSALLDQTSTTAGVVSRLSVTVSAMAERLDMLEQELSPDADTTTIRDKIFEIEIAPEDVSEALMIYHAANGRSNHWRMQQVLEDFADRKMAGAE